MRHPTPIEIEDHLTKQSMPIVGDHIDECIDCRQVARAIETLGDPLTWDLASLPDAAELEEAFSSDPARERVLARIREAESLRHLDPATAVRICDETLELAACRGDSEGSRHLAVLALRERANATRVLGNLPEAHATIRRARQLARDLASSEYENAVLDYIEATVLFEQDDLEPIARLAHRAEEVLLRWGDTERAIKVRFLTPTVEFKRGNFDRAYELFRNMLGSIERGSRPAIEAGLLSNMAYCEVELGVLDRAQRHIAESADLYARCGMETEVTRIRWKEANIAEKCGDLETAESRYRSTEAGFRAAGLELDAALVSLELVELLQRQGRSAEIIEIATRLASVFAEAGVRMSLATTLAALRDAALRGDDVSAPVAEARTAIEELMAAS